MTRGGHLEEREIVYSLPRTLKQLRNRNCLRLSSLLLELVTLIFIFNNEILCNLNVMVVIEM